MERRLSNHLLSLHCGHRCNYRDHITKQNSGIPVSRLLEGRTLSSLRQKLRHNLRLNRGMQLHFESELHYKSDVLISRQSIVTQSLITHFLRVQARRQEFPEGGSSTRVALTAGGLGYLEQNPEIQQFPSTSFKLSESHVFQN